MIVVIHYNSNKDPDTYYGIDEKIERQIINDLKTDWTVERSSSDDWYGQDIPNYAVHHWDAKKKR